MLARIFYMTANVHRSDRRHAAISVMQKFDLDFTWFPQKYDSRVANFNFIIEQKFEKAIYSKRGKEYAIYICTLPDGTGSNQTGFCPAHDIIMKHKQLYDIGLHGPDILFYYHPLVTNPVNAIGYGLHERSGKYFFGKAAEIIETASDKEAALAISMDSSAILPWIRPVTVTSMRRLRKVACLTQRLKWSLTGA